MKNPVSLIGFAQLLATDMRNAQHRFADHQARVRVLRIRPPPQAVSDQCFLIDFRRVREQRKRKSALAFGRPMTRTRVAALLRQHGKGLVAESDRVVVFVI